MGEKTVSLFNRVHDLSEEVNVQHNELAQLEREVKRLEAELAHVQADIVVCSRELDRTEAVVEAARAVVQYQGVALPDLRQALKEFDNDG